MSGDPDVADADLQEYSKLCGFIVSQFFANETIARILWSPQEALKWTGWRFTDNPGIAYSAIIAAAATTIHFEIADMPPEGPLPQNALDAITCLNATLARIEAVEAAGGYGGYIMRWARAGKGTYPDANDWLPDPDKILIGPCDLDTFFVNVHGEPSQDEYTGYALGLGLATKLLKPLDLTPDAFAPLRVLRSRLLGLFELSGRVQLRSVPTLCDHPDACLEGTVGARMVLGIQGSAPDGHGYGEALRLGSVRTDRSRELSRAGQFVLPHVVSAAVRRPEERPVCQRSLLAGGWVELRGGDYPVATLVAICPW